MNVLNLDVMSAGTKERFLCALCGASGVAIFLSFAILMVGVFLGPLWLIALAVFVGCCSIFVIAYVLTSKRNFRTDTHHQESPRQQRDYSDLFYGAPFCLHNIKLPSYDESMRDENSFSGKRKSTRKQYCKKISHRTINR